jgi:inner membrane protein
MPSPVGHALAGVAAGWLGQGIPRSAESGRIRWRQTALFASLGLAPDLDLLVGLHSGPTHSLGVAALAAAAAWLPGTASSASGRRRLGLACALAYGSHILLDWLGTDTSAPIGIMALWPFSRAYYESGFHLFMAVSRRIWQPELFWRQNIAALARELLILLPIVLVVGRVRLGRSSGIPEHPQHDPEERQRECG